jgi:hypothetical protein
VRRRYLLAVAVAVAVVAGACLPAAALARPVGAPLAATELRAAIVGHTLHDSGRRLGVRWHWAGYYRADGRAFARAWWGFGEITATGWWRIDDGRWCQFWEDVDWSRGGRNCYRVHRTADGLRWRHVAGPHAEDHRFERRRGDAFGLAP